MHLLQLFMIHAPEALCADPLAETVSSAYSSAYGASAPQCCCSTASIACWGSGPISATRWFGNAHSPNRS